MKKVNTQSIASKKAAALKITTELFGNDILKSKLSGNKDLIKTIESAELQYNRFVENEIKINLAKNGFVFNSDEEMIEFILSKCEIRKDDSAKSKYGNANPQNYLYAFFRTKDELFICSWSDHSNFIENVTSDNRG